MPALCVTVYIESASRRYACGECCGHNVIPTPVLHYKIRISCDSEVESGLSVVWLLVTIGSYNSWDNNVALSPLSAYFKYHEFYNSADHEYQ